MRRLFARPHSGQMMVMAAMMVTVFFGMLAMSVDVGFGLAQRRASQNSADGAAMAGARLLAKSVDVATDGGVIFIDAKDTTVWGVATSYFTANHVGGPLSPSFATAIEYLDCAKTSLGFSSSSAAALVGTGTKLASTADVPRTTCYVRATSQVQFGTFFGRVIGRSQLTANATATARIAPSTVPDNIGTWPVTRHIKPGGKADCDLSPTDPAPCVFWANNGGSDDTSIGPFKELLDVSRFSFYTAAAQFSNPSDYDHSWPGTNNKGVDLPVWFLNGWKGKTHVGDNVEVFNNGDLGNNNADGMRTYISGHCEGTNQDHPERGCYATLKVYFWRNGETWDNKKNSWKNWPEGSGQPPDRVTLSDERCFRFYHDLVNSSSITGFYVSCFSKGTPGAGGPSKDANTVQMTD